MNSASDHAASNGAVLGLHHVTALAGEPAANLRFYREVLGQRLVKRTVNFDDPTTYHLYYGDESGTPGSILTFFPWPDAPRGRHGNGQVTRTSYEVEAGSLGEWQERLNSRGVRATQTDAGLDFSDPDGLGLRLVEAPLDETKGAREISSPSRFGGVTLASARPEQTARFLVEHLEAKPIDGDGSRFLLGSGDSAAWIELVNEPRSARSGVGTVHHIAFRVADDLAELAWKQRLEAVGVGVSPVMDRQYFHSIYFREPGGVLFEIATDPPGFVFDEPLESLGSELKLPAQYEPRRSEIESALPPLS